MFKRLSLIAALFFTVLAAAQAQPVTTTTYMNPVSNDRTGRWDLGVNISGAMSDENDIDDTAFIGGNASYGWNRWFALGFEGGWQQSDFHNDDLSAVPLFVTAIGRVPTESPFVPYGSFGVGAIVWDFDDDLDDIDDLDADASFAMKPALGVDYFINDHWIFNVEGAYVFTDEEIEVTSESRSVDLDYWTLGAGLKYVF